MRKWALWISLLYCNTYLVSFLPWKHKSWIVVVSSWNTPQDATSNVHNEITYGQDLEQLMEHCIGVSFEKENDGTTIDHHAWEHENQDGDVGGGPCQSQAVYHGVHPWSRTHGGTFYRHICLLHRNLWICHVAVCKSNYVDCESKLRDTLICQNHCLLCHT